MGDTGEEGVKVMRKNQLLIVISYLLFVNNWKKLFVIVPQITQITQK